MHNAIALPISTEPFLHIADYLREASTHRHGVMTRRTDTRPDD